MLVIDNINFLRNTNDKMSVKASNHETTRALTDEDESLLELLPQQHKNNNLVMHFERKP